MSPTLLLTVILLYFLLLGLITFFTSRDDSNAIFFRAGRNSPWYVVAFGMIGASLSGVTFISVPGWVGSTQFSYMQIVVGYLLGYLLISWILIPLYFQNECYFGLRISQASLSDPKATRQGHFSF